MDMALLALIPPATLQKRALGEQAVPSYLDLVELLEGVIRLEPGLASESERHDAVHHRLQAIQRAIALMMVNVPTAESLRKEAPSGHLQLRTTGSKVEWVQVPDLNGSSPAGGLGEGPAGATDPA